MIDIYIAGIAMTVFGRHPERGLPDLAGEALQGALKDAGCTTADLGVAFYAGMTNGPLQGQIAIPGQVVFSRIGIEGIPIYNVENACASGSTCSTPSSPLAGRSHGRAIAGSMFASSSTLTSRRWRSGDGRRRSQPRRSASTS